MKTDLDRALLVGEHAEEGERTLRVLVVEGSARARALIEESIGRVCRPYSSWPVLTLPTELEAALAESPAEILLLIQDHREPSSPELLQNVLRLAGPLPVLVLTPQADNARALQAIRHGAQDALAVGELTPGELCRRLSFGFARSRSLRCMRGREQSQRLETIGVLASGIAHDFNNLLTGVTGNLEMALREVDPRSAAAENLRLADLAATGLSDLTQQLLCYADREPAERRMHDLSELVSQTTELFRVGLPPEVQVVFDLGRVLPGVKCDGIQIRQVLMNLILNGAEAIGDRPGRVTIRTREVTMGREELLQRFQREDMEPGTYVCVEVADTGCGMDPTTAARIFDPFFSTKKSGRGLGLAATLHILRNHGGALSLRSQVGSGTTFELIFPAVQDSCLTGAELPAQKTILLVDDEEAVRGVTRELLTRSGYEVLPADSAESALELVKHHRGPLHAAVLDWTLPGMDGKELGRQLRRTYPAIPIILMSGFHPRDARAHWDEDCPCVFLQKPFQLKDLEERLERLICASS